MAFLNEASPPRVPRREPPPPDHKAIAEKLLLAANDGAKSLKVLFFWYVGALAYAVISVAGITDEQLLKETPLKLPILNVDIPLIEYFAVLPLVVLLVHLELLVQFALLSNKTNDFRTGLRHVAEEEASDFRLRLENFMLSHLLAGRHYAIVHCLLFLLIYGSLVVLPLFALLMIQAQFLAYHSEAMMWWHRALVLADAGVLLYFWPNLFQREDMKAGAWATLMAFRVLPRVILFLLLLGALYTLLAWLYWPIADIAIAIGAAIVIAIVASLRAPRWRRGRYLAHLAGHHIARWALIPTYLIALFAIAYWIDVALIDAWSPNTDLPLLTLGMIGVLAAISYGAWWMNAAWSPLALSVKLFHWAGRSHDFGLRRDAPGMTVFGAQCALALAMSVLLLAIPSQDERTFDLDLICGGLNADHRAQYAASHWSRPYWLLTPAVPRPDFAARAIETDKPAGISSDWCEDNWPETLAGDVVNTHASIPAILLHSVGKRRILVLDEKTLANHDLSPEQREKLRAGDPLARSGIEPIDLRGRNLTGLQANDAVLPRVKVDSDTLLTNASFERAQLQAATLQDAELRGARLTEAELQGALFKDARLIHAMMARAKLDGADMGQAIAPGAMLEGATLQGAILEQADLGGAWLMDANLVGSDARAANFVGALLANTDLRGMSLNGAHLNGAWLWNARLEGTDLTEAVLDFAILVDPRTGRLEPQDVGLMTTAKDAGPGYAIAFDTFGRLAKSSAATKWPVSREPAKCLMILTAAMTVDQPLPRCQFAIKTYEGQSGTLQGIPPPSSFWPDFWEIQFLWACANQDPIPARVRLDEVFGALDDLVFADQDRQSEMAQAAILVLTSEDCRAHFPMSFIEARHQRELEEIGPSEDSADIPMTTLLDSERFYSAWLEELRRIELDALTVYPAGER